MTLNSKLPNVGPVIFTVMSEMAKDYNAINLSQGFPDFDCPKRLRELVVHHLNDGKNQYAPMTGVPKLREQIALKIHSMYGCQVDMDQEVTVTSGATEALFAAIHAAIHPGDEVIIFDPCYDSYHPAIELAGGRPIHIPLVSPQYKVDWELVKGHLTEKTKMIIINTPHNPSGTLWSAEDMNDLASLIEDKEIYIISDEVYEHMVFDGIEHQSILCHPDLAEKSFVISSFGKTYHATGWKIAYCVAPPALSVEFRKIHQYLTFDTITFVQFAIADFMEECPEHHLELPAFYQKKRDKFCELLKDSRFSFTPSQGTYFQLLDYSNITDMEEREYANLLTQTKGVASIPMSAFYEKKSPSRVLRFCFCKGDSTLEQAAEILCKI